MIPKPIPLKSEELFQLATCHRSATDQVVQESYERLEFFGDSILGFVIAEYLYDHYPNWDQGIMSKAKASIVQEAPLAEAALQLGLDQHVKLSYGEESLGGRQRAGILADIFEAIVGAIYLESGIEKARWFILEQLHEPLIRIASGNVNPDDFKSKLQEIAQAMWKKSPIYKTVMEVGQPHQKRFSVQVIFDQEIMGEGSGKSKKEAEQAAAKDALEIIERSKTV